MINFHSYKEEIKGGLISRKYKIEPFTYPEDYAWLAYALSKDGKEHNPLFKESIEGLLKWALSESSESYDRHLAPLSLCSYLIKDEKQRAIFTTRIIKKLDVLLAKDIDKFSVLNDPTQLFCIVLGIKSELSDQQKIRIIDLCKKSGDTGRLLRKVFYKACLLELGDELNIRPDVETGATDPSDLISLIWFYERYKHKHTASTTPLWRNLEGIREAFTVDNYADGDSGIRPLSNQDIALLYESVSTKTQKPDPNMLFDEYPLHPRVRAISESLFKKGEHFNAVFEAVKTLNELLRESANSQDSETTLIRSLLGNPCKEIQNPKIKFNLLDPTSSDYKSQENEQRGLSYLAHGIFFAFRHPKGHEPKDKEWLNIDSYEALDQLVVVSYLIKRIEEALERK